MSNLPTVAAGHDAGCLCCLCEDATREAEQKRLVKEARDRGFRDGWDAMKGEIKEARDGGFQAGWDAMKREAHRIVSNRFKE